MSAAIGTDFESLVAHGWIFSFGFMNTIQCVRAVVPHRCPKSGFSGVRDSTVETGTRCSFHLKIRVPRGQSTRKHSANPAPSSSRQPGRSVPYFLRVQLFGPALVCGGSNTTSENVLSGNGSDLKSARMSGFTVMVRPPCRVSATHVSRRLSTNSARPSALSNQNILDPQQASSTEAEQSAGSNGGIAGASRVVELSSIMVILRRASACRYAHFSLLDIIALTTAFLNASTTLLPLALVRLSPSG